MGIVYYSSKTTVLADLLFSKTKVNHPPSSSVCAGGAPGLKNVKLTPIMNDHTGSKFRCGWEMGSNEFSWSGLRISWMSKTKTYIAIQ